MNRPTLRLTPDQVRALSGAGPDASPVVSAFSWGRLDIGGRPFKDAKLYPGSARAWD